MVEFESLGSVNEFADRTGRDPKSLETLERFSAALAVARRITSKPPICNEETGSESITRAHFVTKVASDDTFSSRYFASDGKARDVGHWDAGALDEAGVDAGEITRGDMFWLTSTRGYDLEADGGSMQRWSVESLDLPPASLQ